MVRSTRRSFMKQGALALVAMGAVPRLRGPQRAGAVARGAVEGAGRGVPARRRRRPEHARAARRPRLLRGPRRHRDRASARRARARSISTASSACTRRSRRSSRCGANAGSRPSTRAARRTRHASHFDAQDYMESGTPGVKSTEDGWLARGLAAAPEAGRVTRSGPWRSAPRCRACCAATPARWP